MLNLNIKQITLSKTFEGKIIGFFKGLEANLGISYK